MRKWIQRKYKDVSELFQKYDEYEAECELDSKLPTHAGFYVYAGITSRYRRTLVTSYEGFEDALDLISKRIEDIWLQGASDNPKMTQLFQTYANNNLGYAWGKQEITNKLSLKEYTSSKNPIDLKKAIDLFDENNKIVDFEKKAKGQI